MEKGSSSIGLQPDNRGRALLFDEWLQARNALSIEIFLQDTPWGLTPSSAPEGLANCVIGGKSSTPLLPCVTAARVDAGE
jgi:hypothetical protein